MKTLIILSLCGVAALVADIFKAKKFLLPVFALGLIAALITTIQEWGHGNIYFRMMNFDSYAVAFSSVLIVTTLLWLLTSYSQIIKDQTATEVIGLVLFSLVGAMMMTSFYNLSMLFLGIEILSIPMYVLAGSKKNNLSSNEAAFKYFLMGAFATGILLFGITLVYGFAGSFDVREISMKVANPNPETSVLLYAGILFILIGLSFKVSVAPFHFWAPDVYQGAPTIITAFMATVVKSAAFAAFLRVFIMCFSSTHFGWQVILVVFVVLTLLIGNISAVFQKDAKRMLAYSGISHAGFMLMGILSFNEFSTSAILYYTAAYSLSSIAAFACLNYVEQSTGNTGIDAFKGLAKSNSFIAIVMLISMLSMAGIPPTSGFFAKYFVFNAALNQGHIWLVIIAVLAALVGVYYYFKIIISMFSTEEAKESPTISISFYEKCVLSLIAIGIIVLGVLPNYFISLLRF